LLDLKTARFLFRLLWNGLVNVRRHIREWYETSAAQTIHLQTE
jgi:hypothetical protein